MLDNKYIKPFKMYGNLYFVGNRRVSVHIIKTEVGLVMIDTGYPDMYDLIVNNMKELGLDPKDICAIIHSHGHIDHFGCTKQFKEISGAKTYIGRQDNDIVNGKLDLSWAKELGLERAEPFDCDVLIDDGDEFVFGNTKIRCLNTPGHTDGVISIFVNVEENGKSIIAAMFGGIGKNSLASKFLKEYNISFDCREKFRNSIHRLAKEHVDLPMGNHPNQTNTEGKLEKIMKGEFTVNPNEWKEFLDDAENSLDAFLEKEQNSK